MSPTRTLCLLCALAIGGALACGGEKTTAPSTGANRVWLELTNLTTSTPPGEAMTAAPGDQIQVAVMIHNSESMRMIEIPITVAGPPCSIGNVSFSGGPYAVGGIHTVDIDPDPGHIYFAVVPPIGTVIDPGDWLFAKITLDVDVSAENGTIVLGTATWVDDSFRRELNFFDPANDPLNQPAFEGASFPVIRPSS